MVVHKLNFKGILLLTILTSIITISILLKTDLDNITIYGIDFLISVISFGLFANLKIKNKKRVSQTVESSKANPMLNQTANS